MGKSFYDFDSVFSYCQTYQKAYNKISSKLLNNNGGHNQEKYYKVLLQGTMLEKLPKAYVSLVTIIDTKRISYTSANLRKTIHKISQFLKANPLKVFHASNTPIYSYSNKRPCLNSDNSALPACSHLVCISKRLHHLIDKCWELHPKQRPASRQKKIELSNMKIKRIASSAVKDNTSTFNISW